MGIGKTLTLVACTVVGFAVSGIAILLLGSLTEVRPGNVNESLIPLYLLAQVGVPAATAAWIARRLRRRWNPVSTATAAWSRKQRALWALGAAYGLTAVFGVPLVQSDQTQWAISEYKRIHNGSPIRAEEGLPRARCFAAIPVIPGLILTYHEYQVGGVYGLGTFELYGWYGVGSKSIAQLPLWIS
jgi:hypothetical protein